MRRVLLGLGLFASIALVAAGCADDDNPTGSGGNGGSTSDTTSMAQVSEHVGTFDFESIGNSIEITSAGLEQAFPTVFGADQRRGVTARSLSADSVIIESSYSYTQDGDWHIISMDVTLVDTEDGVDLSATVTDSIRFTMDGSVVVDPTSAEFNGVETRKHFEWWRNLDSLAYGTGQHDLSIGVTVDSTDSSTIITLNGNATESTHAEFGDDTTDCVVDVEASQTLTELVFTDNEAGDDDCPISGSAMASAAIDLLCTSATDTLSIEDSWTVTTTVLQGGDIRVTFDNGRVTWSVTDTCSSSGVSAPVAVDEPPLRQ